MLSFGGLFYKEFHEKSKLWYQIFFHSTFRYDMRWYQALMVRYQNCTHCQNHCLEWECQGASSCIHDRLDSACVSGACQDKLLVIRVKNVYRIVFRSINLGLICKSEVLIWVNLLIEIWGHIHNTLFYLQLTNGLSMLECLLLAGFSNLIWCLGVRPGAQCVVDNLKGASLGINNKH